MPLASPVKNYRFKTLPDILVSSPGFSLSFCLQSEFLNIFNAQTRSFFVTFMRFDRIYATMCDRHNQRACQISNLK
ncbi:hypothetical protein [Nostoc sp. 106C]|uniref:hypothetical protein n=1 Tax=Nostoc sp. 106C TaxID=1932667 RepID=UPI000A3A49A1|nr:hypothetical protein [Nostoc sp. 106C]OUL33922.1 hypothetical protein BV375_05930 [Nostoc sp. 106C]